MYDVRMSDFDWQTACRLSEIPDQGAVDAEVRHQGDRLPVMLLRQGDQVHAYLNVCPHQGRMLNFAPDRFMVQDGIVMCSHHGATFRVTDGTCIDGPCRGAALRRLDTLVQDGQVLINPIQETRDA